MVTLHRNRSDAIYWEIIEPIMRRICGANAIKLVHDDYARLH